MGNDLDLELAISEFLSLENDVNTINNRNKLDASIYSINNLGYHEGMSEKEFIETSILIASKLAPKHWRKGQSVFNYIDLFFGLARYIQFNKHTDCFYDDSQVERFLSEAYKILNHH